MTNEILMILDSIEREKGIPKEVLFEAIEAALLSAAKKILGKDREDISVAMNRETGKIVVTAGNKEVASREFGRIAAQTAKQVIIQKIREAEREIIFEDYQKRLGTIITGNVHRFDRGSVVIDLGKTEGILPRSQQCSNERYRQGDRIRVYILEVTKTNRGPQIILSRSNALLVKKLFELEVPEISEGIVEIRAIAREAGERTKIAVYSKDEKVDPVGACVGMRGNRVKDIVKEDQLSMAIGKHGQNVRLASQLIGWELNIKADIEAKKTAKKEIKIDAEKESETDLEKVKKALTKKKSSINTLDGVGKKAESILLEAKLDTIEKIAESSGEDLAKLKGIGKKTAEKIIDQAKSIMEGKK